jgi:DNA-binding NarL/FixJ family response regulator
MKIVIADDSMLIRDGVAGLLTEAGQEIVARVGDARALLREVALTAPEVAVIDIRMPPTHTDEGITAAHTIRRDHPRVSVLVLSQYLQSEYALRLIRETPEHVGYLLKERVSDLGVLIDALERVVAGDCVIDPAIVSRLLHRPRDPGPLDSLTPRETEVLTLMAEGRSNAAIVERLDMSPKTLEAHIRQILRKLNLNESEQDNRRVLAVLTYLRSGHG